MSRPILASLFLLGLVSGASPAIAGVEAELSGHDVAGAPLAPYGNAAASYPPASGWEEPAEENEQATEGETTPVVTYSHQYNQQAYPATPAYAYQAPAAPQSAAVTVVTTEAQEPARKEKRMALIPLIGATGYVGRWNDHINNDFTSGLILEMPLTPNVSFEAEGNYGRFGISYSYFSHNFDQFILGGNGKLYLTRGVFNPYLGAGILGVYYNGMTRGPSYPYQYYDQWIGSGQLVAGGDIELSKDVAIGVRGSFVRPLFNRPYVLHNGITSAPGYEEAAAIDTGFARLMGTLRIGF